MPQSIIRNGDYMTYVLIILDIFDFLIIAAQCCKYENLLIQAGATIGTLVAAADAANQVLGASPRSRSHRAQRARPLHHGIGGIVPQHTSRGALPTTLVLAS